ncbi:glycosyltransferase family A protein [Paenibacillus koleovorans]|uniref:glycosyltransferase family A protein n=1 Tax=Paenibacillus koleovorans TaxID=121608 RepID=UPI0013E2DDFD|nr:glycosyltransferase family A protein [Paenibacillus koleovorans]
MTIEVTVIIPSFNRYPLNELTLQALERQNFDMSKLEVILVDDASTDKTYRLTSFQAAYSFRYFRNSVNRGLAYTRNVGIRHAQGRVLIFLDAEMLVGPDYVAQHYRHHLDADNKIVVGMYKRKVYSNLFPDFVESQWKELRKLERGSNAVKQLLERRLEMARDKTPLEQIVKAKKKRIPLIRRNDLAYASRLERLSVPGRYSDFVLDQFGQDLSGIRLAWLSCLGSNHSATTRIVRQIGGYCEDFVEWGEEDLEFAYRMHQAGAVYVLDQDLIRYHQEHPPAAAKLTGGRGNWVLFQKKHPVLEVCIRSLILLKMKDYRWMNDVVVEHDQFVERFPIQFQTFKASLIRMLQAIPMLKLHKQPVTALLTACGIVLDPVLSAQLEAELQLLRRLHFFPLHIELYELLSGL